MALRVLSYVYLYFIDVIFNSLEDKLLKSPFLKPLALNEVMRLNPQQTEAEEVERSLLMRGFELDASDAKDSISTVSSASIKDWNIRARDGAVCNLQYPDDLYSVWVSYSEIYNEQVFDLLEACDKKKKRTPLRVTEDRKGKFYVKGYYLFLFSSFIATLSQFVFMSRLKGDLCPLG